MQIIPAIDLMGGLVVRGIGGRRNEYRPVQSVLAADARPRSIAKGLARLGFKQCYVADLDAIAGAAPALDDYEALAEEGLDLWIDAGISDRHGAEALARHTAAGKPLAGIVTALETLSSLKRLAEFVDAIGPVRLIFSLDLMHGRTLGPLGLAPMDIVHEVVAAGVERMIILDLAHVGTGQGPGVLELCKAIRRAHPGLELASGGGVRSAVDLAALAAAGCDFALVASAIHLGYLSPSTALFGAGVRS